MKKIIIIPVREDSKRLPGKALLEVNSKPLWYHTYLRCGLSCVDEIWIATDSRKIFNQCTDFNISSLLIKDCWCGTERVAKAYQLFTKKYEDDLILNVQCDYPQINPKSINLLFNQSQNTYELWDFITLYYTFQNGGEKVNPSIVKIIGSEINNNPGQLICHYFTRQFYPYSFGHIGLYLFQPSNVENILTHPQNYLSKKENLEQNTWLSNGAKIKALFTERELSVDTEEDFQRFKTEIETNSP